MCHQTLAGGGDTGQSAGGKGGKWRGKWGGGGSKGGGGDGNSDHEMDDGDFDEDDETNLHDDADAGDDAMDTENDQGEDVWLTAISEVPNSTSLALVAVNIRAHAVRYEVIENDTTKERMLDALDIFQPTEVIVSESVSESTWSALSKRTCAEGQYIKRLCKVPASQFRVTPSSTTSSTSSSTSSSSLTCWSQALTPEGQQAAAALTSYLKGFGLEACMDQPDIEGVDNVVSSALVPTSNIDISASSSTVSSSSQHKSGGVPSTWSFRLDGITAKDLEVFTINRTAVKSGIVSSSNSSGSSSSGSNKSSSAFTSSASKTSSSYGSLFWILNYSKTSFGQRTLKRWLLNPLKSVEMITRRQDAISWLAQAKSNAYEPSGRWLVGLQELISSSSDVERLLSSLHHKRISPKRLLQLFKIASQMGAVMFPFPLNTNTASASASVKGMDVDSANADGVAAAVNGEGNEDGCNKGKGNSNNKSKRGETLGDNAVGGGDSSSTSLEDAVPKLIQDLVKAIKFKEIETSAIKLKNKMIVSAAQQDDINCVLQLSETHELPSCNLLKTMYKEMSACEASLADELNNIRKFLKKPSLEWKTLKTGVTSTLEHLVEVTVKEAQNVPIDWQQVNSTKTAVRFHTPQTLRLQVELEVLRDEIKRTAKEAWLEFLQLCDQELHKSMRLAVISLGELDALLSLCVVSSLPGYVRPSYTSPAGVQTSSGGGGWRNSNHRRETSNGRAYHGEEWEWKCIHCK